MKKVLNIAGAIGLLAFLFVILFPQTTNKFFKEHVFLKSSSTPIPFVQMKDPNDTTKIVTIPMVEDSSFRGGGYLTASTPNDSAKCRIYINKKVFEKETASMTANLKAIIAQESRGHW